MLRYRPLAFIVTVALATTGCHSDNEQSTTPQPVPPAKPTVVTWKTDVNLLSDNQAIVTVKNEGDDGWVKVLVSWNKTQTSWERGESGAEKAVRETFTRKPEPGPTVNEERYVARRWSGTERFASGEQKTLTIDLPGHSSWDGHLSVVAVAVLQND